MDTQPPTNATPMDENHCPICSRELKKPHKCKPLYGMKVCRKCRNSFANRRQAAYLIDVILFQIAAYLVVFLVEWPMIRPSSNPAQTNYVAVTVIEFGLGWLVLPLFFFCKDGFNGYSLGKWLMGVQVIDVESREPIRFLRSLKRNLVLLIPYVGFFGVVLTMMKGKRWGDGWAKTQVVWKKYEFKPPFDTRGLLCTGCGYNLTGNVSGRCPECGLTIPARKAPFAIPVLNP